MKHFKKNSLLIGTIIITLIVISPYLLYISESISPDIKQIETIFGTIKSGYFPSIQVYVYWISAKFVPFFLLTILYVTNKSWWAPAILVPITVYLFQLISVVNDNAEVFDELEFIYTTPILIPVLATLYFIKTKIEIYIEAIDLKKEMDTKMKKKKVRNE